MAAADDQECAAARAAADGETRAIAVPFIVPTVDASGNERFTVTPEAIEYLSSLHGRLSIVSVAGTRRLDTALALRTSLHLQGAPPRHAFTCTRITGTYRSGKSFLMNRLAGRQTDPAFAVGHTTNACTKGIWLWGEAVPVSGACMCELAQGRGRHDCVCAQAGSGETQVLFMDTEGLGSTDRGESYDVNIFALAILLSSTFVYNSVGVIDSEAMSKLSLVVQLTRHIRVQAGADAEDGTRFGEVFPSFVWVVRDFALQGPGGRAIRGKDYLREALKVQDKPESANADHFRRAIKEFFPNRNCVTMERPVSSDSQLHQLESLPDSELRPGFQSKLEQLRGLVVKDARPKELFGQPVSGCMLGELAQQYVDAINDSRAPVISSAWKRVVESQCSKAVGAAVEAYSEGMGGVVAACSEEGSACPSAEEVVDVHVKAQEAAMEAFESLAVQDPAALPEYSAQVRAKLAAELRATLARVGEARQAREQARVEGALPGVQAALAAHSEAGGGSSAELARVFVDAMWAAYGDVGGCALSRALCEPSGVVASALGSAARACDGVREGEAQALQQELEDARGEVRRCEARCAELQQELERERGRHEREMAAAQKAAAETRAALESQLSSSRDEVQRWGVKVDKLVEGHTRSFEALSKQLEAALAEAATASGEARRLQEAEVGRAHEEARQARELVASRDEAGEARVEVARLAGQLEVVNVQLETLRARCEQAEAEREEAKASAHKLKAALDESDRKERKHKDDALLATGKLASLQADIFRLQRIIKTAKEVLQSQWAAVYEKLTTEQQFLSDTL